MTIHKTVRREQRRDFSFLPQDPDAAPVMWRVEEGLTPYQDALNFMEEHVDKMLHEKATELVWLVEHPPVYTAGTSARKEDLLQEQKFPVFYTGRGGKYTYHGPGQRVIYVMLNLQKRKKDVHAFVASLEEWIIRTLDSFGIKGERRDDRVGVWVKRPERKNTIPGMVQEDKVAALGVRLRKWISYHGIAFNVEPDLSHYEGIVPCGLAQYGVTSLVDLGLPVTMDDFDLALRKNFVPLFGKLI